MIIKITDITNYKCVAPSTGQDSCIGSKCMGWVWETSPVSIPSDSTKENAVIGESTTHGHCGLIR